MPCMIIVSLEMSDEPFFYALLLFFLLSIRYKFGTQNIVSVF